MATYIVDLSAIVGEVGASLDLDEDVSLGTLRVGDTVAEFESAHLNVTISNTGEGLVLLGSIEAEATFDCARCLERFTAALSGSIEGSVTPPEDRGSVGEDEEWYPLSEDGSLDLMPVMEAALAIEIPYAPLHDEGCLGICPLCGCDRNKDSCACVIEEDDSDNPFSVLKELVDRPDAE